MSKNYISSPDAATGKTTAKQEKYEKKMAKYLANKARKEQKEKEKMTKREQELLAYLDGEHVESLSSELKEIEKVLVEKARYFFATQQDFIHFPITYKGELNLISAVSWGRDKNHHEVTAITVNGSNERNELDELWDIVLDKELDIYCINLLSSGKKHNPRCIKADTPEEAFRKACIKNNVKLAFYAV